MDHQEAMKTRAVDRYLLGEMPPAERDAFEEHYFSCTVCGEELQIAGVLTGELPDLLREGSPERARFRWAWLTPQFMAAAAAAVLLVVVVAYQNFSVIPSLEAPRLLSAAIILDGQTRAAGTTVAAGDPLWFQMALDGLAGAPRLRVELENGSGRKVRAGEFSAPAAGQPLGVFFPGSLDPGRYRLVIREEATGKEVASSGFQVVK